MLDWIYIAAAQRGPGMGWWLPYIAMMGVIFYVLLIRPQQKQRREQQQLLTAIKTGDKVITIGGIYGLVTNVKNGILVLKVAEGVKIEVTRDAIRAVVNGKQDSPSEPSQGAPGSSARR